MSNCSYNFETLIRLLKLKRSDNRIKAFISQFDIAPIHTVDKEDDADDEYIEFKEQGFGFYFERDTLLSIFLHSAENNSGYSRYNHPLPKGIFFEQSKSELLKLCGEPDVVGGGHDDFFGDIPEWVKYMFDDYTVHVEFTSGSMSIQMVTIM